jgi:hypothetical protein
MANDEKATKTEEKKQGGSRWLSYFGIAALILLVIVVIWAMATVNKAKQNPMIQTAIEMMDWVEKMDEMSQSQIDQQAQHVTAVDLANDPEGYGGWWTIDGHVSREESQHITAQIAGSIMSDENYGAYLLDDGVVLVDISGENVEVPDGAYIKGFGKPATLYIDDVWELPIIGPDLEQEYSNVQGMEDHVVFFISKGIEILEIPEQDKPEPLPGELVENEQGDLEPAGDAKIGEGEAAEAADTEDEAAAGDESEDTGTEEPMEPEDEGEAEATE